MQSPPFAAWAAAVVVDGNLRQLLEGQLPNTVAFSCSWRFEFAELYATINVKSGEIKSNALGLDRLYRSN